MVNEEISLLSLFNTLNDVKASYGQKINYLHGIFETRAKLPDGVTNSNDGPGLWPGEGVTVFTIVPQHVLGDTFCSVGLLVNVAGAPARFQLLLIEHSDVHPELDGHVRFRSADTVHDRWTDWRTLMDSVDLKAMVNGVTKVGNAATADRLTTPRAITLGGVLGGSVAFDGSEDVVLEATSERLVPINVVVEPGLRSQTTYLHVLTLPPSSASTHDHVRVMGHVGAWSTTQDRASLTLDLGNRDGARVEGLVLGNLGTVVDLVITRLAGTGELHLYLQMKGWVDRCMLSVYGDQVTVVDAVVDAPMGVAVWRASIDAARITGRFTNIVPTETVQRAASAEKVVPQADTTGTDYLASVSVNGDVRYTPGMIVDHEARSVTAETFVGDLAGNATSADSAVVADNLNAVNANTRKGFVVGVQNDAPIYDNQVYLTTTAGQLHATSFEGASIAVSTVTAQQAVVTGQVGAGSLAVDTTITGQTATLSSRVTAPLFVGDLQGNAATATTATTALNLKPTTSATTKALLCGLSGNKPYVDTGVYLTTNPGEVRMTTLDVGTVNASGNVSAVKFIGSLQGNADTATTAAMATKINVTSANNLLAPLVAHVSKKPYADPAVYLTTTPGQLHVESLDCKSIAAADSVTATDFIGHLQGNADTATTASLALELRTTSNPNAKAYVVGVAGDTPYRDPGVYLSTVPGQLVADTIQASNITATGTVKAAYFDGVLQGTAAVATVADSANKVNVTLNRTKKAFLVGHEGGYPFYDDNVYLTTTTGQLYMANALSPEYHVKATVPKIIFHHDNASGATSTLSTTSATMLSCSSNFTAAKIYNAVWNDYAEFFPKGGDTEPGDVVALDLTAAGEAYVRAFDGCTCAVGVHTDECAHIIGGEQPPLGEDFMDHNLRRFIPVALAGRVRVKFTGPAQRGARVVPAADGCARLWRPGDDPIAVVGMLVEADTRTDVRRLRIKLG